MANLFNYSPLKKTGKEVNPFNYTPTKKVEEKGIPSVLTKLFDTLYKNSTVGMAEKYVPKAVSNIKGNLKALSTPETAREWQAGFPKTAGGDILRTFTNAYIAPAAQIPYALKETFGKGKTLPERGVGALQTVGNIASTVLPGLEDIAFLGYQGLKGYGKAAQQGAPIKEKLLATKKGVTGEEYAGLGEALVKEPGVNQNILNMAELPIMLLAGKAAFGAKGVKGTDAKSLDAVATELSKFKNYDELLAAARTGWQPGKVVSNLIKKGHSLRDLFTETEIAKGTGGFKVGDVVKYEGNDYKVLKFQPEGVRLGDEYGFETVLTPAEIKGIKTPKVSVDEALDQAKITSDDMVNTELDKVRELIDTEDLAGASKLYNTIDNPNKPDLKAMIDEVDLYHQQAETEGMKAFTERYGEYQREYNRIKAKVKAVGESTAKETGELYREHVPEGPKGEMASDEVASALGISENDLMVKIADEIASEGGGVGGGRKTPTTRIHVSGKKIRETVAKMPLRRGIIPVSPGQQYIPEVIKQTYNAEPTEATLKKIGERETAAQTKAAEVTAKNDFNEWQKQAFAGEEVLPNTPSKQADLAGNIIKQSTMENAPLTRNLEELKDLSGTEKKFLDTTRVGETVFGKRYGDWDRIIAKPFAEAKVKAVKVRDALFSEMNEKIIKPLGGRKSKESADIQKFGEGLTKKEELVAKWGEIKANKIIEADTWFRNKYDWLIDALNEQRAKRYPDDPTKLIQKRTDYYRHFSELAGYGGLRKALQSTEIDSPAALHPAPASGRTKVLSMMKKRLGLETEYDAVGGFIDYVPQAMFDLYIPPTVRKLEDLLGEITKLTQPVLDPATGVMKANPVKLDRFRRWLNNEVNFLTGKPNEWDKGVFNEILDNPKVIRVLDWTNRSVKGNVMLGNLAASLVQSANMVQGAAKAGLKNFVGALGDVAVSIISGEPTAWSKSSTFKPERYSYKGIRKFDVGLLEKSRDFAAWLTTALDELGTNVNGNAMYRKGLEMNVSDPIRYADLETGKLVGERGIGMISEAQRSAITQFIAPFQLEVTNNWWVMRDMVDAKEYGKVVKFLFYSYLYNSAMEQVTGRRPLFDPIDALSDVYGIATDETTGTKEKVITGAGRMAGEVLSNIPYGQTIAATAITSPETRKKFFGEEDPTRYGGGLLTGKVLADPLFTVLNPLGVGGTQIKRTIDSLKAISRGFSITPSGGMRYPVSTDVDNVFQILAMGQYSTPTAQFYFKNDLRPLSEGQVEQWKGRVADGESPEVAWATIYKGRLVDGLSDKYTEISKEDIPDAQKTKKAEAVVKEYNDMVKKLDTFATGKSGFGLLDLLNMINGKGTTPEVSPTPQFNYAPEVSPASQFNYAP